MQRQLQDLGTETYLPLLKSFKKDLRKGQPQIEPFFPGYVFVVLTPGIEFLHLRRVCGLVRLVCFDGQPAQVSRGIIQAFHARENGSGHICLHRPPQEFRGRDSIEVSSGPLAGVRGLFVRYLDGQQRVCVLLDILRRQTPAQLPVGCIRAA